MSRVAAIIDRGKLDKVLALMASPVAMRDIDGVAPHARARIETNSEIQMTKNRKPIDLAKLREQLDSMTAAEATDMMLEFKAWVDAQSGYITDEMTNQAWADIWERRRQRILDSAR